MTGSWLRVRHFINLFWLLSFVCWPVAVAGQTAQSPVTASVQPAQVTVGDSVTYEVTVSVTGAGQPSIAVPILSPDTGLSNPVKSGTQTGSETYIINGQMRSVQYITTSYVMRTSKVGKFTIPPATVTLNGKSYDTQPVEIQVRALPEAKDIPAELTGKVVAPQVRGNSELQRRLTGVVFVLPVISSDNPYNGEQVRIAYHLVIDPKALQEAGLLPQTNLDNYAVPKMSEFIKEELYPFPQDIKFQERDFGGRMYLVAPVYEAVITSTKTGKLEIEPFLISMLFSQRNQSSRGRSMFADDPFFSSMSPLGMMGGNTVNVIAQSPSLTLDIKPVPTANRPADFAGAVGNLSVSAQVDKKTAKAYEDTVQLDVVVEGEGDTESLSPPTLPNMPGFTVLGEPEAESGGRKENDKYISVKKFSYSLRPTFPGKQTIPEISLSIFEPTKEQFERIRTDPIDIQVAPGSKPAPIPDVNSDTTAESRDENVQVETDLRYISTGDFYRTNPVDRFFRGNVAYLMFLIPAGLLLGSSVVALSRRYRGNRQVDMRKLADNASARHLKAAHQALGGSDSRVFYAELAEGVRYFFAARFDVPVAEVTIPEIEERLIKRGAPAELVNQISGILEVCDSAQYAPATRLGKEDELMREAESALKAVERFV